MSVKIVNKCVGCTDVGLHCIGSSCPNRNIEVHYCDRCGAECSPDNGGFGYDDLCHYCSETMEDDESG